MSEKEIRRIGDLLPKAEALLQQLDPEERDDQGKFIDALRAVRFDLEDLLEGNLDQAERTSADAAIEAIKERVNVLAKASNAQAPRAPQASKSCVLVKLEKLAKLPSDWEGIELLITSYKNLFSRTQKVTERQLQEAGVYFALCIQAANRVPAEQRTLKSTGLIVSGYTNLESYAQEVLEHNQNGDAENLSVAIHNLYAAFMYQVYGQKQRTRPFTSTSKSTLRRS